MLRYKVERITQYKNDCSELVNDRHSALNPTIVSRRLRPLNLLELTNEIKRAAKNKEKICIAGGRHAMGGQQFKSNGVLIDTEMLKRVLCFDREQGIIEIEAGMQWPELICFLQEEQNCLKDQWSIIQKQTGCNSLSIGGALSANVHGRGLKLPPIVANVKEFKLINADADLLRCSREENSELFARAIGGYGLFGMIASVTLELHKKQTLRRSVQIAQSKDAVSLLEKAAENGASFGDFQFAIDHNSPDFLQKGILSFYTPVDQERSTETAAQAASNRTHKNKKLLSESDWQELLYLAHTSKSEAFDRYADHYLRTNGQLYESDSFQLATYIDNYHQAIDSRMPGKCQGSEMICEFYVPRDTLGSYMARAAIIMREQKADLIYGTVRLIEEDRETFLPWASQNWACIVMNLHVEHNPHAIAQAACTFNDLIAAAVSFGGSYYLTYHRFARKDLVLAAHPRLPQMIQEKLRFDPDELFTSNWYEHMKAMFQEAD